MPVSDKDLITFINQMPPEMKQNAIKGIEFLRCMTIADYKAKQIEAAEALIIDIQHNPAIYTTVILNEKFKELLGGFEISEELEKRIMVIKHFISYRSAIKYNTDGSVEEHKNATYDEYIKSKNYEDYLLFMSKTSSKKSSKKK